MVLSSVASQEPDTAVAESAWNPPYPQLAPFEQRSKRIRVYKNGDVYHPGRKLIVSGRIYRNWEQFLHSLSSQVELLSGAVQKVFTVDGKPVRSLDELEENGNYVAAGRESFRKVPYPVLVGIAEQQLIQFKGEMSPEMASKAAALIAEQKRRVYGKPSAPVITPTLPKKNGVVLEEGAKNRGKRLPRLAGKASEDKDKIEQEADSGVNIGEKEVPIFGPSTKAFRVVLFANDEPGYQGKVLVLNNRNCKYFDQLLKNVSDMMHLKNGSVQKVFDAKTGQRIRSLQQLRDGQNIVCTGYEPFRRIQYNTFNPSDHEKKTTLSENTKTITVYMNGDPYHTGFIISVKESRFPNMLKVASTDRRSL
ncbi:hypothetical protein BJ742DRAFT_426277 [Cladochytrium replicatum]|nr:hypothetical protein BJ742DRAFT_426277 [Cladochytrium replicatum]